MNDKAYWHLFDDKAQLQRRCSGKTVPGRGWLKLSPDTEPAALEDVSGRAAADIIGKPLEGCSGAGHCPNFTQEDWAKGPARTIFSRCCSLAKGIGIHGGSRGRPASQD